MKLLHATGNAYKFALMQERLKDLKDIELVNPKMLNIKIDVVEDGKTVEENSIKKAKAYYEIAKIPVIAEDAGLYIDKFSDEEQPGMFVKRVNGIEGLSDDEIRNYYINKLNSYGGESLACYRAGVCIVDQDGIVHSDMFDETKFLLTTTQSKKASMEGGILGPISYDLSCNKYFNERTPEEDANHYKDLNNRYIAMIKNYVLKEN